MHGNYFHFIFKLSEAVDVPDVEVEKPKFDYLSFKPKDIILDNGGMWHIHYSNSKSIFL